MSSILVVEPEPRYSERIHAALGAEGWTIRVVSEPAHALQLAAAERPDLVLVSADVPGAQALAALSRSAGGPGVVGMLPEVDFGFGTEIGADDHLAKPFTDQELRQIVRDRRKSAQLVDFCGVLGRIRRRVSRDLRLKGLPRRRVLAAVVMLIDRTHIRIGCEDYVHSGRSRGAATLTKRNVRCRNGVVALGFTGKGGRRIECEITSKPLARVIAELDAELEDHVGADGLPAGIRRFRRGAMRRVAARDLLGASVDDIVGEPVSRVIVRDPEATADDFIELAANLGLHGTDYVVGWTAWLDLSPVGVSKASGLQHVCDRLGVSAADVLAIGDGRNDIEMLRWAGRGVAMGQAVDEVKAAADDVTVSVNDEGAALEMSRWFCQGS